MKDARVVESIIAKVATDQKQLSVVKSNDRRLIVEAPAGFGKTSTMVSMIGYWIASGAIPKWKRILCLSFSVSAANRMKDSVTEFFAQEAMKNFPQRQMLVTNFHGFCRMVLRKYGYLVGVNDIDDTDMVNLENLNDVDEAAEKIITSMKALDFDIKSGNMSVKALMESVSQYAVGISSILIPQNKISYNGIIIMTLYLFQQFPAILGGYQNLISAICVDEFQDTNILGLSLITILLDRECRFVAFGDQMQQIYDFQGAVPNLIDQMTESGYSYIQLDTNYRFANNPDMLEMDRQLRAFRDSPRAFSSAQDVPINLIYGKTVFDEATAVIAKIRQIKSHEPKAKFAILVGSRSESTRRFISFLRTELVVMDATFTNENQDFISFQSECLISFQNFFHNKNLRKIDIHSFVSYIEKTLPNSANLQSYMKLLEGLLKYTTEKFPFRLRNEHIVSILEAGALRRSISDVDSDVIVSTIHGAKGLEWEYVFIVNFEQFEFPVYPEMKNLGISADAEQIDVTRDNEVAVKQIINKLYVAFSRAKRQIYFAYADERFNKFGRHNNANLSVLASLPFLKKNYI